MVSGGLFRVQGIEDRSEDQVGRQAGTFEDRACFWAFPRHSPCSVQALKRIRL